MLNQDGFGEYLSDAEKNQLREIVEGAIRQYDDTSNYGSTARRDHTKGLRAQIRNAHMNGEAQRVAAASPRMRYTPSRGRALFTVGDQLLLSFNKLSPKSLRPRTSRTNQAQRFVAQQKVLPGMPTEVTNVVVGYTTDKFETLFDVYAVAPGPNANHWACKLDGQQPDDLFANTPAPAPTPVTPETPKRRVILRSEQSEVKEFDANDDVAAQ
jgi:hypothetical protein